MENPSLGDRQAALVKYLLDPVAYAAEKCDGLIGPDKAINPRALRLMGEMTLRKRKDTILAVLPRTCAAISGFDAFFLKFAKRIQPTSYQRSEQAEQFLHFMENAFSSDAPPVLDLAKIEIAILRASQTEERHAYLGQRFLLDGEARLQLRLLSRFELVKCGHDVRSAFQRSDSEIRLERRLLNIVVLRSYRDRRLRVLEVQPALFDLLSFLRSARDPSQAIAVRDPWSAMGRDYLSDLERMDIAEIVG